MVAPPDLPETLRVEETKLIRSAEVREYRLKEGPERHRIFNLKTAKENEELLAFWKNLPPKWSHYGDLRRGTLPRRTLCWTWPTTIGPATSFGLTLRPIGCLFSASSSEQDHQGVPWQFSGHTVRLRGARPRRGASPDRHRHPMADLLEALTRWIGSVARDATICFIPSGALFELPVFDAADRNGVGLHSGFVVLLPTIAAMGHPVTPSPSTQSPSLVLGARLRICPRAARSHQRSVGCSRSLRSGRGVLCAETSNSA